jgi:hypothetical protein
VKPKAQIKAPPVKPATRQIKRPALIASVVPAAGAASAADSSSNRALLGLLLAVGLGLTLLFLTAFLAPARALPHPVFELLDQRRDLVVSTALALGLGIGVGLIVVVAT